MTGTVIVRFEISDGRCVCTRYTADVWDSNVHVLSALGRAGTATVEVDDGRSDVVDSNRDFDFDNIFGQEDVMSNTRRTKVEVALKEGIDNPITEEQADLLVTVYNENSQAYDCFSLNGEKGDTAISSRINVWVNKNKYVMQNKRIANQ